MRSALYTGTVAHARLAPRAHAFRYRVAYLGLDLDELPRVFAGRLLWSLERPNVASFRRADYLGPAEVPLGEAVRTRVEQELGQRPDGPITLVTQVRILGHVFNPVSFYLCHDSGGALAAVVAEITNTPWNERFAYVLDARGGQRRWRFPKRFHVSPFLPMELEYDWRLAQDERGLAIHMTDLERGEPVFHAGLTLTRRALDGAGLARALLAHPLLPLRIHAAIYWQALRLWLRRTPFFPHPSSAPDAGATSLPRP
ncbi:MAG TPA: DUF1365 domain-containing protein [Planctomycetota bacterium]